MLLNEHQSKRLFQEAGLHVPLGELLRPEDVDGYKPGGRGPWFCKAQVLAGGRGKAGGILRADTPAEVLERCRSLFGMRMGGQQVPLVRVEQGMQAVAEFYLSFAVSRSRRSLVLTVGAGGMDVEELARSGQPEQAPLVQELAAEGPLREYQLRAAFFHLAAGGNVDKSAWPGFRELVRQLHGAVRDCGLLLAEINPLVLTADGVWAALDGKVEIDDTVRDLKPELERFYTPEHYGAEENRARNAGLSFVPLRGWVGLLVNGAGLAMATMDLLNYSDLPAANFMDLGGAADAARMRTALELLFEHPRVEAIFLNLFGGIVSCETVALALREALGGHAPRKPLVVRMAGNSAAAGRAVVAALGHSQIQVSEDMGSAMEALRRLKPHHGGQEDVRISMPEAAPLPAPVGGVPGGFPPLPLPGKDSKVLIQGITGRAARLHTELMLRYGTRIAAGVTPFKEGGEVLGVPVFNSVQRALVAHPDLAASVIFVPAAFASEAILEAAACAIPWIVCITEGIPQQEMLAVQAALEGSPSRLIGPNTPGLMVPGQSLLGIMPGDVFSPGPVAVFSRSGTLTYETAARLSKAGLGQSLCVGVGGDPFIGAGFVELLEQVRHHEPTRAVIVLGEIGGTAEEELAAHVRHTGYAKPLFAFVAGRTAPPGRRLGHAGAILESSGGSDGKLAALAAAGIRVCPDIASIPALVGAAL